MHLEALARWSLTASAAWALRRRRAGITHATWFRTIRSTDCWMLVLFGRPQLIDRRGRLGGNHSRLVTEALGRTTVVSGP